VKGAYYMPVLWGRKQLVMRAVCGGPYKDKPAGFFGVKMAAEIDLPCDVDVPTKDYSTPTVQIMQHGLLAAYRALIADKPVYVGCMGGIGRTGLFLACLAKISGIADPVRFVRAHYLAHAVETDMQQLYVHDLDVSWLTKAAKSYDARTLEAFFRT